MTARYNMTVCSALVEYNASGLPATLRENRYATGPRDARFLANNFPPHDIHHLCRY